MGQDSVNSRRHDNFDYDAGAQNFPVSQFHEAIELAICQYCQKSDNIDNFSTAYSTQVDESIIVISMGLFDYQVEAIKGILFHSKPVRKKFANIY